jgi:hypothetical protein
LVEGAHKLVIMAPALKKGDDVVFNLIDEPVFSGDSPGPASCQLMLQGFGLTNAAKGIRGRVLDEVINLVALLLFVPLPIDVVVFKPGRECYPKSLHFSRRLLSKSSADS